MKATRQFVRRVQLLAPQVGAAPVSKADAEDMYDLRSRLVHGADLGVAASRAQQQTYTRMEEILRLTLRKAISDGVFAAQFNDDASVSASFPI